jgi:hypothetical protein
MSPFSQEGRHLHLFECGSMAKGEWKGVQAGHGARAAAHSWTAVFHRLRKVYTFSFVIVYADL